MNFIKKNIKLIIGFVVGVMLTSGIAVYADYAYNASQIGYTKTGTEIENVSQALNDLYDKKQNYVLPTGTYEATTKSSQIDIGNYKYLDTSKLYTASEVSGKKVHYDKGTFTVQNGAWSVTTNFRPATIYIWGTDASGYYIIEDYHGSNIYAWCAKPSISDYSREDATGAFTVTNNGFSSSSSWSTENGRTFNYIAIDE